MEGCVLKAPSIFFFVHEEENEIRMSFQAIPVGNVTFVSSMQRHNQSEKNLPAHDPSHSHYLQIILANNGDTTTSNAAY